MVAVTSGANMNFDRLRLVTELADLGANVGNPCLPLLTESLPCLNEQNWVLSLMPWDADCCANIVLLACHHVLVTLHAHA